MLVPLIKITEMQRSTNENHWVLIADETGLASIFPSLKERLSQENLTIITVVYHSDRKHFTFRPELTILTSHFPARLYVIYETVPYGKCKAEAIEPVINANTTTAINFTVSGSPEFTMKAKHILTFLGIHDINTQEQFFRYQ
ncbi:hypothetical protein D4L85_15860 [Chryseolinea soli]|uniref:Uncharacterized protein n=1 Tax=Chryseolinea soli TaxID=2321403 RepID=A0A385SQZ2_9BACT|nr:hypothetical protein D4L85_15860 [Chryseolinea soli]